MERAYRFRIYPNQKQCDLINKTFGCSRYVYNYYLDKKIKSYNESHKTINFYECSRDLTILKRENEWLKEVDKCSLQNSLKDLEATYKSFFSRHTGSPKYKTKKKSRMAYRTNFTHNNIEFKKGYIKLPKLGLVKFRDNQIPKGRILNATISKTPSGKYYVSLCCTDVVMDQFAKTGKSIGIDLGIRDFAITSDGDKISNSRYLNKSLKKLAKLQRSLSRKPCESNRRNKARIKVARQYEKITNQRHDFLNKLSTELISEYDVICIEDLNVSDLLSNGNISREVSDVSWFSFRRKLEYKANWYGKKLITVDRFYPSSQTCNHCGYINKDVKDVSVRTWVCPNCKTSHDRDINSAINILHEGLRCS